MPRPRPTPKPTARLLLLEEELVACGCCTTATTADGYTVPTSLTTALVKAVEGDAEDTAATAAALLPDTR